MKGHCLCPVEVTVTGSHWGTSRPPPKPSPPLPATKSHHFCLLTISGVPIHFSPRLPPSLTWMVFILCLPSPPGCCYMGTCHLSQGHCDRASSLHNLTPSKREFRYGI